MRVPFRKPGKYSQIPDDPLMTKEKISELKKKLSYLKKIQPEAAKEVSRLAELGDFSENAEYQLAKSRLRGINDSIRIIEKKINSAVPIQKNFNKSYVQIGCQVTLLIDGKKKEYKILGSAEANPVDGVISWRSPIGSAVLNKKINDKFNIKIGNKDKEIEILEIN